MQNVYHGKFLTISFIPEKQRLIIEWLPTSVEMTDEEFKSEIESEAKVIEKHKPNSILARTTEMGFAITPDLQDWHNDVIFPVFKSEGVSKLAVVLSKDIFSQASIEQLIQDNTVADFTTQYFDSEEKAIEWLQASSE